MKDFINSLHKVWQNERFRFFFFLSFFYLLLLVFYGYLMLANLSSAPQFVYAQF